MTNSGPIHFKMKITGKVNQWNVLTNEFVIGTTLDDVGITTTSPTLIDELVEAMKNRDKISITIGEREHD